MIVVGTTLAAFATDTPDTSEAWLRNAEAITATHPDVRYSAPMWRSRRSVASRVGRMRRWRR